MVYLPALVQLTGFQISDGKTFDNIMEARKHQNELAFLGFLATQALGFHNEEEFIAWLDIHQERLMEYFYVKMSGGDPNYMDER